MVKWRWWPNIYIFFFNYKTLSWKTRYISLKYLYFVISLYSAEQCIYETLNCFQFCVNFFFKSFQKFNFLSVIAEGGLRLLIERKKTTHCPLTSSFLRLYYSITLLIDSFLVRLRLSALYGSAIGNFDWPTKT